MGSVRHAIHNTDSRKDVYSESPMAPGSRVICHHPAGLVTPPQSRCDNTQDGIVNPDACLDDGALSHVQM
jgi:hypothetical protein